MNYVTVRLDKNLLDAVDALVKQKKPGYKSRSEFVHDAVRRRIEGLLSLYPELKAQIDTERIKD